MFQPSARAITIVPSPHHNHMRILSCPAPPVTGSRHSIGNLIGYFLQPRTDYANRTAMPAGNLLGYQANVLNAPRRGKRAAGTVAREGDQVGCQVSWRRTSSGGWSQMPRLENRPVTTVTALTAAQPPSSTHGEGVTQFI